jgi:hypothetical protein
MSEPPVIQPEPIPQGLTAGRAGRNLATASLITLLLMFSLRPG